MKKTIPILFTALSILILGAAIYAEYDAEGPLCVRKVEFCEDRPKGLGIFKPRQASEFDNRDDEIYIYIEAANCKPKKEGRFYYTRLALDIAIYYEDGRCIYSEEEVNIFDHKQLTRNTDSYIWTKIDALYLKKGEYKVELTVRDLNADKEAFTVANFKKV